MGKAIVLSLLVLFALILLLSSISAICNEGQIDINTATLEDMMKIKWMGGMELWHKGLSMLDLSQALMI